MTPGGDVSHPEQGGGERSCGPDWIAYVGPFPFPWGAAGSRRVLGVAMSIAHTGRRVVVASGAPEGACEVVHRDGAGGVVEHVPLGELMGAGTSRGAKAIRHYITWGRRTVAWLDSQSVLPRAVIIYGGGTPYARRVRSWCRARGLPVAADVVEWYSPKQMTGGVLGPDYLSATWAFRREYRQYDGIIAISTYLRAHFDRHGLRTVLVPPSLDLEAVPTGNAEPGHGSEEHARLRVVYSGTPGRKDNLWDCIRAFSAHERDAELLIAGPSLEAVLALNPAGVLPSNVQVLGRLPQPEAQALVAGADFTILAREEARHTRAGFPTKVVESLAVGTPVITNLTSDLGEFLVDGGAALIAHDPTPRALEAALRRAIALSAEERAAMRACARQTARRFDYRELAAPLDTWLSGLVGAS